VNARLEATLRAKLKPVTQVQGGNATSALTDEWFAEQRGFFNGRAQLSAAICGRRAGKTRGEVRDLARDGLTIPGAQLLYLNSTRGEAERLAWWGNRGDGIASLVQRLNLDVDLNRAKLSAHFRATDAWLYLVGADDEVELRKRLGGAYHKVVWDEAQKIPPRLELPIREVFMPALLDFGGMLRLAGTPSRQMNGLFWSVTRPEPERRLPGWSVSHWNLLQNPYWGRGKRFEDGWRVVWGANDDVVSGPHSEPEMPAAIQGARWTKGILALQQLYGGPDVAPIDSPIMQREAFGRWVREDSNFVYAVNRVPQEWLFYAPERLRPDTFPDVEAALADLPRPWKECFFALGVDLGYNDPFAFVLWAWHRHDPYLWEVVSWKRSELDSDAQNAAIMAVREVVSISVVDADAGGIGKQVVKGWSKEWVDRYRLPIAEAEKQHKLTAIQTLNADILRGHVKFRTGSPLLEEMRELQWSTLVDGSGRMVEDPTMPNDVCDAALYGHRRSYQYRMQPEASKERPRPADVIAQEEIDLEDEFTEDQAWNSSRVH